MLRLFYISLLALGVILTGCQTSLVRSFEKVHVGMDKHQVLETMGDPTSKTRLHGKDRWIYRFYDDGFRFDKEVHFLDGVVIYSGEPWAPEKEQSAEVVDQKNAEQAATLDKELEKKRQDYQSNYTQYESESHNRDRVKYMPAFSELK